MNKLTLYDFLDSQDLSNITQYYINLIKDGKVLNNYHQAPCVSVWLDREYFNHTVVGRTMFINVLERVEGE